MLTKEQILKANDIQTDTVDVPEWGGTVKIKEMTGADRDSFEQSTYRKNGSDYEVNLMDMRARLCALCMVDDNGVRLFSDVEVKQLSQKSAKALDRVFAACQSLNGLTSKDMKELEKNLGKTQADGSISV